MAQIYRIVSDVTGITPDEIVSKHSTAEKVRARYLLLITLRRERPDWPQEKYRMALNYMNYKAVRGAMLRANAQRAKCKLFERDLATIAEIITATSNSHN